MANETDKPVKKSRKEFRKDIQDRLTGALHDLQNGISDKRFARSLEKAGKILSRELRPKKEKKPKKKKEEKKSDVSGSE